VRALSIEERFADSPAADMNDGGVIELDDDIVTCDREVAVNTADGPPLDHGEPDLHQKCHVIKTIRGELISREGELDSRRFNYPICVSRAAARGFSRHGKSAPLSVNCPCPRSDGGWRREPDDLTCATAVCARSSADRMSSSFTIR